LKFYTYIIGLCLILLISYFSLSEDIVFSDYDSIAKNIESIDKLIRKCNQINALDTNIVYANHAYRMSEEIGYEEGKIKSLHILGLNYYLAGDYEKSIYFLLKEAEYIQSKEDNIFDKHLGENFRMLGEVNRASREFELASDYLMKSEKLFIQFNDKFGLAKAYNRIAALNLELADSLNNGMVLEYLQKSNDIAIPEGFKSIIRNNLNLEATYYLSKDIQKSLEIFKKTLNYFIDDDDDTERASILKNISNTFLKNNQPDSALKYIKLAYEESLKIKINAFIYQSAFSLYEIYDTRFHNIDSAFHYLRIAQSYQLGIYDDSKRRSQLLMQFKYESDIKDKEIGTQKKLILSQIVYFTILIIILAGIILFYYINSKKMKKASHIIHEQKEELSQTNVAKDKFFSIIAHDLRNPISAFKSLSVMMDEDYNTFSDVERREFIRLMKVSSENVSRLLENLLTWSRSQSGKIPFNPRKENLLFIVNNTLQILGTNANEKGLKFVTNVNEGCEAFFDASMIQICLMNILSNSIKFSDYGSSITINCSNIPEDNNNLTKLIIIDEGRGMSPEQIEKLFSISDNQSTDGTNGEKGTGLGMVIVSEFVERNNGKLIIESEVGKGTTIEILLPGEG
jgi:signal transduction histidine kinase